MVKIAVIKSPDEWATTKQTCRDERICVRERVRVRACACVCVYCKIATC